MLDLITDYDGKYRYASLVTFDWFEVEGNDWMPIKRLGYELVTDSFLQRLQERVEKQKSRSSGYTKQMLERLGMAEKLLKELQVGKEAEQSRQG